MDNYTYFKYDYEIKNKLPIISIIIPAFNAEKNIKNSIESILSQTYNNYELIIIDNNSTDNTWQIINEYSLNKKSVKVARCFNQGVSSARNYGIEISIGDYICFLDADDFYDSNVVEERTKFLLNHDSPVTTCNILIVDENHNIISKLNAKDLTFKDFFDCPVHTNSVMFRKDIIKKVMFETSINNGEDWLTWSRVARMGYEYKAITTCNVSYVQHQATVHSNFFKHTMGLLTIIDIIYSKDLSFKYSINKFEFGLNYPPKENIKYQRLIVAYIYCIFDNDMDSSSKILKILSKYSNKESNYKNTKLLLMRAAKKYYKNNIHNKLLEFRLNHEVAFKRVFNEKDLSFFYDELKQTIAGEQNMLQKIINVTLPKGTRRRDIIKKLLKKARREKKLNVLQKITPDERLKLKSLKNKFKGKRCFIIGNGPSLNRCNLSLLKDEYTFAVNGIFYKTEEMNFRPTFYMVEDSHVIDDNLEKINAFDPEFKFFPALYKEKIFKTDNTYFFTADLGFYRSDHPAYEKPRFSKDFSEVAYCGQSVTYLNMQLAYYLGFTEVYLIGMDFSYQIRKTDKIEGQTLISNEDDINHFHPDYFGKGKKWHDPKVYNVAKNYEFAKEIFEIDNRNIYNATFGGKLEIFKRTNYDKLFT